MNTIVDFDPTKLLAHHGKSFYWASTFMSKKQQLNAALLYSFCRYLDDAADEVNCTAEGIENIKQIRSDLISVKSHNYAMKAIHHLVAKQNVKSVVVEQLIDGVAWDLNHNRMQSDTQLIRYCYGVASTVGLLMCQVTDVNDKLAWRYAIDLGIAMQLTNIARDVIEDAQMGRIYIPQDWFAQEMTPDMILNESKYQTEIFHNVKRLINLADTYYRSADHGLCYLSKRVRLSILVASRVYEAIGKKILKLNPESYWAQKRVFTTKSEKLKLSLNAIVQWLGCSTLKHKHQGYPHNNMLHTHIEDLINYAFH